MDKGTVIEHVKEYAEIVRLNLPVKMVVLYGSYAKGEARKYSDIDVAVIVDKIEGDYLKISTQLYRLCRDIDIMIEPILLVDGYDPSGFLEDVLKTGEIIYKAA